MTTVSVIQARPSFGAAAKLGSSRENVEMVSASQEVKQRSVCEEDKTVLLFVPVLFGTGRDSPVVDALTDRGGYRVQFSTA